LDKVQKLCGVSKTSLGSLSEAARVFDPALLEPIIAQRAERTLAGSRSAPPAHRAALADLIAVDGSLLQALPQRAWALWPDAPPRAARRPVAVAVFPAMPAPVAVTAGNGSERAEWRRLVQPGGFDVADRGYADDALFRELEARECRFVVRVQENAVDEVLEDRPLRPQAAAAGVVRDVRIRRLGTEKHNPLRDRPRRIVIVRGAQPDHRWVLATNALDLSAELVAAADHDRWPIERSFRWLKCGLGGRRLVSQSASGGTGICSNSETKPGRPSKLRAEQY